MNSKLKNYIDGLFADIPRSKKANDLKEELLSNMNEKFDDFIAQGKSESQAYSLVISNMGDIDEMLTDVMPNADFVQEAKVYRKRNARNTAISVGLYFIGVIALIASSTIGEFFGMDDMFSVFGLIALLSISAIATGILIYTFMSTPPEYKDFDEQSKKEALLFSDKNGKILKSIISIYWTSVTCIYLFISFMTMQWHITWLIWIFAAVIAQIIKVIYELRHSHE